MNIEEIDKWLDSEYGVSYTRLGELHDFLIEQSMKYQDKSDNLQQENKQLKEEKKQAIEEINYMITNADITEISAIKLKQILGDKE